MNRRGAGRSVQPSHVSSTRSSIDQPRVFRTEAVRSKDERCAAQALFSSLEANDAITGLRDFLEKSSGKPFAETKDRHIQTSQPVLME
jgi:hypothetical protein